MSGALGATLVFLAWLPPHGFLFGTHWLVLHCLASEPSERRACVIHFCAYMVGVTLLGAGGWWSRTASRYTGCHSGNHSATMTRSCMWTEQNDDYMLIYVGHYTFGCILVSGWILDGLSLPSWMWSATRDPPAPLRVAYSPGRLWPGHTILVALTWIVLCVTWQAIMPWSTSPQAGSDEVSINDVAIALVVECLVVFAIGCVVLRWRQCGEMASPKATPLAVSSLAATA